ncbi:MAG: TlpA family protein disulfide reductase [Elusimicrobia bacterium]|nr:TlpA family protein disulfide reductase [Elusimicrobiota bacterium]
MPKRALSIAAAALAVGVLAFLLSRPDAGGPVVGSLAPEFRLTDLSGRTVTLADYRGKVVLLDFWATWCSSCESEVPGLKALDDRFKGADFALLAASVDEAGPEVVARYAADKALTYRILFADEATSKAYRIFGLPSKFLIGRDGKLVRKYLDVVAPDALAQDVQTLLQRSPS